MKQFKEGDWVRIKDKNFNAIFQIDLIDEFGNLFDENQNYKGEQKYWELWKPRKGEWFWFCPDKDCPPTLTRLDSFSRIGSMSEIYCEPFIGELPKFLKEVT